MAAAHDVENLHHDAGKKKPEPLEHLAGVVTGAGEEGSDLVAVAALQEDAAEPSVVLEMPDHGLDAVSGDPRLARRRNLHRVRSLRVMRGASACCTGLLPLGLLLAAGVTVVDS